MSARRVLLYFAWSRPAETNAPLTVIDDRFPALFELRRLFYPRFEELADRDDVDQGSRVFSTISRSRISPLSAEQAEALTGSPVIQAERVSDDGSIMPLDPMLIADVDTIVVISFDSFRTGQVAAETEIEAIKRFLDNPGHLIFVCPHHDIGETTEAARQGRDDRQIAEHLHHGDPGIPPRQGFGGFARTLLAGLGVPVEKPFWPAPGSDRRWKSGARRDRSLPRRAGACSEGWEHSTSIHICRTLNVSVRRQGGWRCSPGRP